MLKHVLNLVSAAVSLTLSEPTSGSLDLAIDKSKRELLTENETTVMVMWTGGGQGIKKRGFIPAIREISGLH